MLLGLALIVGAGLRFTGLNLYEMSADEGASWAAAAQPSFLKVIESQRRLNPAELGLHDVSLHYWMDAFGDSLAAMRALSALAGTLAILLTWLAARELLALNAANGSPANDDYRDLAAGLAALLIAVNLITIKYSLELRMYPLMLALVLAQVSCFLRTARRGTLTSYFGTAIFTALAIGAHPMAILVFASEGAWILYPIIQHWQNLSQPPVRKLVYLASSVGAGLILAGIAAYPVLRSGDRSAHRGLLNWVQQPSLWEPFALFNKGIGSVAFPVFAALAIWGAIGGWRRTRSATIFALLWMWLPPFALMIGSYAVHPVFVERYLLAAFVPFFILAAIGIMELPSDRMRTAATMLAVVLALGHDYAWSRKPHDAQWHEGARIAAAAAGGKPFEVAPGYAVNVVRYYLRDAPAAAGLARQADTAGTGGDVLLLSDQSKGRVAQELAAQYPHVVVHLRGLDVRSIARNRN